MVERVSAIDHYAYPILILQREFLAALPAQPEMLDRMGIFDLARSHILVETEEAALLIIEGQRAIRIGA